jgi:hypothetical protein
MEIQSAVSALRAFAHRHDEMPAFHAGYLVLVVLTAALLNLGVFALLVATHMSLDIVKYHDFHGFSWKLTAKGTLRESLIDVMLLLIGLVFAVYLHHGAGVIALSGFLRAEGTIIRALGMIIPKLEVFQHVLHIFLTTREHLVVIEPATTTGWSRLDCFCLGVIALSGVLLVFAIPLLDLEPSLFQNILTEELIPWRL